MMFTAAEEFSCEASNNNQLKDIRFVNSDTPTYEAFRREFNKLYGMKKHLETRRRLDELEISLATERQTHQETRQRISELETLLEAERQIHQEARRRLKELETSLAEERQRTNELETSLVGERQRTSELETSLAAERQTHQETRQRTSELETSLETERQRTNELETSLAGERQTHQEIRQRTNELERSLEMERQAHQETRQRSSELETSLETERQEHQETRGRTNELETTLTAIQQTLEEYRNSRETRDWVLARNEISLSRQVIGEGAWGKVVEGTFRGCKVAVKQIHELILSPHNRRRFEREMSIASRCRHPCLLQFIGATNDDQSPLFVTELLDTSLRAVLQERALDRTEITAIALDIAKGLNYLHLSHPAPIIHRDISSANVLLWKQNNRWRGKVADYGTANFLQLSMTTCPGAAVYSAPESQTSTQTPKVDVYSFGVLLCEMNNRELPDVEHRNDQIVMVTDHFFRGLVRRCLHQDPKERPSMKEILDELSSYQSQ